MNPHLTISHCRRFTAGLTRLGGTVPADLQSLLDSADAITEWSPGADANALGKAIASREFTAKTAAKFLQDEYNRPARDNSEVRATATAMVVRTFGIAIEKGAADAALESLRPTFDRAKAGFDEASNWITPSTTAEQVLEAGDEAGSAWRALAEHKRTLDQLYDFVYSTLHSGFSAVPQQPFMDTDRECVCAFFVPATFDLNRASRALEPLRATSRGGRWTRLRAETQLEWNTLSVARKIIADQQEAHNAEHRRQYTQTHPPVRRTPA